jgi:precorrin-6A/cobalt-precorrin-6A reductase
MPVRERRRLLTLGGTAEARLLAGRATAAFGDRLQVTTSLAGRTRAPAALVGEVRRGGFGGAEGLAAYLRHAAIDMVVDATHPFAARISTAASIACRGTGVPLLLLARPGWLPEPGDRWIEVGSAAEGASILPTLGRRAFLTIGHAEIEAFAGVVGVHFVIRLVDPPTTALPLGSYELIIARGPFVPDAERRIMVQHAIDVVVAKASGGEATAAKLVAARELAIPVLMLRRPEKAHANRVGSVDEALSWVELELRQAVEFGR